MAESREKMKTEIEENKRAEMSKLKEEMKAETEATLKAFKDEMKVEIAKRFQGHGFSEPDVYSTDSEAVDGPEIETTKKQQVLAVYNAPGTHSRAVKLRVPEEAVQVHVWNMSRTRDPTCD